MYRIFTQYDTWVLFFLYLFVAFWFVDVAPVPSDDLFYIDAAYQISVGSYKPPNPNFPYHHYLRWPVFLPLAGLYGIFGYGMLALTTYRFLCLFAIGVLSYSLAFLSYKNRFVSLLAGLVGLIIPFGIIGPYIRSEPWAVIWTLLAILCVYKNQNWMRKLLCGFCVALAVNSTMISLYNIPAILVFFLLQRKSETSSREFMLFIFLFFVGVFFSYLLIMLIEWSIFGNFWIQFDVLDWWIFHDMIKSDSLWRDIFNPHDKSRFIFAFTLDIIKTAPLLFLVFVICVVRHLRSVSGLSAVDKLFVVGFIGFLFFELFGVLAMVKLLRYAVFPLTILSIWLVKEVANIFIGTYRNLDISVVSVTVSLAFVSFLGLQLSKFWQLRSEFNFMFSAVSQIMEDVDRQNLKKDELKVFFETYGLPGHTQWIWAAKAYSNYWLQDNALMLSKRPNRKAKWVTKYFVNESPSQPDDLVKLGYKLLPKPNFDGQRSLVYVSRPKKKRLL